MSRPINKHTCFEGCRIKDKSAFSLVEMLVVIAIVAMLVALAIPAINAMQKSFNSTGAEGMISTALATARTLAISNNQYAGVRFQTAYDINNTLKADQYMIFIIEDGGNQHNWVCGFVAVEGYKPMKLPSNIGVTDMMRRNNHSSTARHCSWTDEDALDATNLVDDVNIADTSAFSIVFSSAGKLVTHELRCARKTINDGVFNDPPTGMFIEDDHDDFGTGVENSRANFVLYDRDKFRKMTTGLQRFDYLKALDVKYINPYTGEIIK